jgi:hypothetical protein
VLTGQDFTWDALCPKWKVSFIPFLFCEKLNLNSPNYSRNKGKKGKNEEETTQWIFM